MTIEIRKKWYMLYFGIQICRFFREKGKNNNLWQLVFLQNQNDYKMVLLNEIYIYIGRFKIIT